MPSVESASQWAGRGLVVLLVGVSQAAGTQITKSAFRNGLESPFALTWLTTSCGALLGLPAFARWRRRRQSAQRAIINGDANDDDGAENAAPAGEEAQPWLRELLRVLLFYAMYAAANLCYQVALQHEDAAVVAAVFSAAPAFVCVLSWVLLSVPLSAAVTDDGSSGDELMTGTARRRRTAVVPMLSDGLSATLAVAGILVAVHPWSAGVRSGPYVGLAAISPVMAAFYKVLFARFFPCAGPVRVGSFLAKIAAANAVIGPIVLCCAWFAASDDAAAQRLLVPHDFGALPWGRIALVCVSSVAFNLAVNYGVTIMPPLMVSIGTVLSTAFNIGYEAFAQETTPSGLEWGGIALICSSLFVLLGAAFAIKRT